jgi:MinD-like ATPase involved in chromosome partitioning or flagellar assembly
MKIAVYSAKGSAGKTPISTNIALDKDFCIGTNEAFHIYDSLLDDNQLIALDTEEPFPPELLNMDINIVFDLAGSISKLAVSITSALSMSDVVLVPIYNEYKSLVAGLNTIHQIHQYNQNVIVIATKLQKDKKETFSGDWRQSNDYKNIANAVAEKFPDAEISVLPLKYSKAFDSIFEKQQSIQQMMQTNPLARYNYREVASQFNDIYTKIEI